MSDEAAVLTEQRGRVLLITLNRPEAMNAINEALSSGLVAAVEQLDSDPGLTAGVLTGNGRGFCAGMDLKAFARGEDIGPMMQFIKEGAKKPLIGAIEGFAIAGGLELALTCDLLVAAQGAKLGIREVKVGLFAAGGGVFRLPNRVGFAKAMEMALTGDSISAEEAHELGMVSELTESGHAVEAAVPTEASGLASERADLGQHRDLVHRRAVSLEITGCPVEERQGVEQYPVARDVERALRPFADEQVAREAVGRAGRDRLGPHDRPRDRSHLEGFSCLELVVEGAHHARGDVEQVTSLRRVDAEPTVVARAPGVGRAETVGDGRRLIEVEIIAGTFVKFTPNRMQASCVEFQAEFGELRQR